MDGDRKYHVVESQTSRLGRFQIRLDMVEENGEQYPYSYVMQKGSVGILGFEGDQLILIRQYRHSISRYEYEIPGGGVELGEEPTDVAFREMMEETGYSIESMEELGTYYPSPGSSNEICHLFVAQCKKEREPISEPLEYIDTILVDEKAFNEMIQDGSFKHSMGLVAWLKFTMLRGQL